MKKNNIILFISSVFLILVITIIYFINNNSKFEILAEIGNKKITKRDFLLNYEFGLSHLKIGETLLDRKKKYLEFMINEYLLSLHAESIGLDNAPSVKYQSEKIKNELLLESIIENEIKPNIKISMDEIKEAINKSKIDFQFFYWPEQDLRNAQIIKKMFEENGIEETFKKLSKKKSDSHFDISKYSTDYLSWKDLPEETFEAIKDLPVNQFSDPIKIGNLYFIFKIQDIRRTAVTTGEYLDKATTFRKILYSGKILHEVVKYVDKLVTPRNIKTKTKIFKVFANAVFAWHRTEDKKSQTFSDWVKVNKDINSVQKFYNYQDSILITYNNGTFTLGEFQEEFYFDRIVDEYHTKNQFNNNINNLIAISIRDYFLEMEAIEKKYDRTPWFKHEYMKWNSKFAFEEQLRIYMKENSSDGISIKDRINVVLDSLRTKYQITINHTMLDTLNVNETEKSKQSSVLLMKRGVNRLAEPIVDGHWNSTAK